MFFTSVKIVFFLLVFLIETGCGLGNPSSGHDPNLPMPIQISDRTEVLVNHTLGAIISTPDGRATLSISQSALSADTSFKIEPFVALGIDMGYYISPEVVTTLIPGQFLRVAIFYNSSSIPNGIQETDLRLGLFDTSKSCWKQIFLDSPSIIPGTTLHQVAARNITQLGLFGVTGMNTPIC
ncbi:MAG: hypothetical protein HY036_06425 [Nitrospirae bacterium]|nr:hypothetical protein [Nitrospirota bacterium]MBI3352196.1 hypothetical protein [Nitrospirota bacterium]